MRVKTPSKGKKLLLTTNVQHLVLFTMALFDYSYTSASLTYTGSPQHFQDFLFAVIYQCLWQNSKAAVILQTHYNLNEKKWTVSQYLAGVALTKSPSWLSSSIVWNMPVELCNFKCTTWKMTFSWVWCLYSHHDDQWYTETDLQGFLFLFTAQIHQMWFIQSLYLLLERIKKIIIISDIQLML